MAIKSPGFALAIWSLITGKPSTFPPSAHTHPWTDITSKPTTFTPSAHTHVKADITDFPTTWAWASLTGVPASFPPSSHTHVKADITDFPTTWAWASLTGVPATFTPAAHVHAIADVTNLQTTLNTIPAAATVAPVAAATPAAVGVSTKYAREDHRHPPGVAANGNELLGTFNIAETGLVLLALGVRRVSVTVAGAVVGGNYMVFPTAAVPAGFGIVDCVCAVAGQISFGMLVPAITGNYSIPVRVVKVNT